MSFWNKIKKPLAGLGLGIAAALTGGAALTALGGLFATGSTIGGALTAAGGALSGTGAVAAGMAGATSGYSDYEAQRQERIQERAARNQELLANSQAGPQQSAIYSRRKIQESQMRKNIVSRNNTLGSAGTKLG